MRPRTFQLDLDDARDRFAGRGRDPRARTSSARRARRPTSRSSVATPGIPVVFDAAHAFGASVRRNPDRRVRRRRSVQPDSDQAARRRRRRARRDEACRRRRSAPHRSRLRQPRRLQHAVRRPQRPHVGDARGRCACVAGGVRRESGASTSRSWSNTSRGSTPIPGIRVQTVDPGDSSSWKDFTISVDADTYRRRPRHTSGGARRGGRRHPGVLRSARASPEGICGTARRHRFP